MAMSVACGRHNEDMPILFVGFNQDYTSLGVGTRSGYSLLSTTGDRITQAHSSSEEPIVIVERLYISNLLTLVSQNDMRKLLVYHYRKELLICHYRYTHTILALKMNRQRLVVCVEDGIFIHNIRDMELMHKVEETPPNRNGVIALSSSELNCYLAYPGSHRVGTVYIFDALNFQNVTSIAAHDGLLAALAFDSHGSLLATASEKGTVIRVFAIPQGEKVMEFRRGLARCATICSLSFSMDSQFLVAASNTETVHVFKLEPSNRTGDLSPDLGVGGSLQTGGSGRLNYDEEGYGGHEDGHGSDSASTGNGGAAGGESQNNAGWGGAWMGWMNTALKASAAYLPHQVSEVFAQDRAFAWARVPTCMTSATTSGACAGGTGGVLASAGDHYHGVLPALTHAAGTALGGGGGATAGGGVGATGVGNATPVAGGLGHRKIAALVYHEGQARILVAGLDGLVHTYTMDTQSGGEATLLRSQRLLDPTPGIAGNASSGSGSGLVGGGGADFVSPLSSAASPLSPGVFATRGLDGGVKAPSFAAAVTGASKQEINHGDLVEGEIATAGPAGSGTYGLRLNDDNEFPPISANPD